MVRLTGAKAVTVAALRWVPFFFVTLEVAFETTTATLAAIVGFGEMAGLSTLLIGKRLDAGGERTVMVASLVAVGASGVVALQGSIAFFAISFVLLMLGAAHMTVSGHAWVSARASYERRARFIGIFETSWAIGLLLGAPAVALLISAFGWRAPFVAVSVSAAVGAIVLARMAEPGRRKPQPSRQASKVKLTSDARILIGASAATAMAGLTTIVVVGTWLNNDLGLSTGGIGLVAMAFGAAELVASSSSAAFADRMGKLGTTTRALALTLIGLFVISQAGSSLLVAVIGLLLFLLGFEYGIVTSFSLVSEAMPTARGHTIATNSAVGTIARGSGAVLAGWLYERFGIDGPALLSGAAATVALVLLGITKRRSRVEPNSG